MSYLRMPKPGRNYGALADDRVIEHDDSIEIRATDYELGISEMPGPYRGRLFGVTNRYGFGYKSDGEKVPVVVTSVHNTKTDGERWQVKNHEVGHHKFGSDEDRVRRFTHTENIDRFVAAAEYN